MVGYLVLIPADSPHLVRTDPVTPLPDEDEPLVRIDTVQRTAQLNGEELDLTYLEFELLAHLVAHPNRVHTRDQLVTTVWGYGHVGDGRTVDVHIARLRRKLGVEHRKAIQTVRRVGYKYTPPTAR
jgi:DNA-binding response OmpR family regulator